MKMCLLCLTLSALVIGCISDETREAASASPYPYAERGAWRGESGITGVGGTGTGGNGQAGVGFSGIGVDRQRTTGTGSAMTNRLDVQQGD